MKWPKFGNPYVNSMSAQKKYRSPQTFYDFLRTLVIALTIPVRTMSICCWPEQIFPINQRLLTTL